MSKAFRRQKPAPDCSSRTKNQSSVISIVETPSGVKQRRFRRIFEFAKIKFKSLAFRKRKNQCPAANVQEITLGSSGVKKSLCVSEVSKGFKTELRSKSFKTKLRSKSFKAKLRNRAFRKKNKFFANVHQITLDSSGGKKSGRILAVLRRFKRKLENLIAHIRISKIVYSFIWVLIIRYAITYLISSIAKFILSLLSNKSLIVQAATAFIRSNNKSKIVQNEPGLLPWTGVTPILAVGNSF